MHCHDSSGEAARLCLAQWCLDKELMKIDTQSVIIWKHREIKKNIHG